MDGELWRTHRCRECSARAVEYAGHVMVFHDWRCSLRPESGRRWLAGVSLLRLLAAFRDVQMFDPPNVKPLSCGSSLS